MGLIGEAQPYRGRASLFPSPMGESGSAALSPQDTVGGWGVEAHTGHSHPLPSSLSRLLSTQRPQGTGSQRSCKDPLPEGGPRMYCLPRPIVNSIPEDSSWWDLGRRMAPPSPPVSQQSGLTCTHSQRQISSSSNELI